MASHLQFRILHGVLIPDFLRQIGVEPTEEAVLETKEIFKRYLRVKSTAALSDAVMSQFISALCMLFSREFGIEVPLSEASKSMKELLKDYNYG